MKWSAKITGYFHEWNSGISPLMFLLLLSLVIKCSLLFSGEVINLSGVRYVDAARQFAGGHFHEGLSIEKMPFYPILIAVFHLLVRDWELSGKLISLLALVSAVVPLYGLTSELFDRKTAFWTGLAFALCPALNSHAVEVIRDPVFLAFVMWGVYFFWRALNAYKSRYFVMASAATIFALLCRIEGVFLFAVFFTIVLVLAIKNASERLLLLKGLALMVGLPLLLLLMGAGLVIATGRELTSFNRFGEPLIWFQSVLNGNFLDMYRHLCAELKAYKNPLYPYSAGSFAETGRHYLPFIYLISVAEAVAKNLFLLFVFPLLAGLVKRPPLHRGHWLILLLTGTYLLVGYYFLFTHDFISRRYFLVPTLLLFPWVGWGLERFWASISRCRWPQMAMALFLLVFCAAPALKSLDAFIGIGKGSVLRDAGKWLSMQPEMRNAVIACSDPRVRFYSSENFKFIKQMEEADVARDFGKMERVATENEADLLVIETSKKNRKHIPEFENFYLLKDSPGTIHDVLIYQRENSPSGSSFSSNRL